MLSDEQYSRVAGKLRYVQIAAVAMILIVAVLIPVMCQLANWQFRTDSPPKMLTVIAAFAALMMFAMSLIIPRVFSGAPASKLTGNAALDSALGLFTTESFIQLALLEGAAMINLVVFSVEHHVASIVLVGIGILLMLVCFPRASKASSVINDKLDSQR